MIQEYIYKLTWIIKLITNNSKDNKKLTWINQNNN